ncbi:MAG: hypothetical protein JWP44_3133, partial [Mucilaginibacter sp.]|nr:hypothetical protein [Mucilaginibacter sp.]
MWQKKIMHDCLQTGSLYEAR